MKLPSSFAETKRDSIGTEAICESKKNDGERNEESEEEEEEEESCSLVAYTDHISLRVSSLSLPLYHYTYILYMYIV
ncbi:unnamed protein product [Camellia sinensis]